MHMRLNEVKSSSHVRSRDQAQLEGGMRRMEELPAAFQVGARLHGGLHRSPEHSQGGLASQYPQSDLKPALLPMPLTPWPCHFAITYMCMRMLKTSK